MQCNSSVRPLSLSLMFLASVAAAQTHALTREDLVCPCLEPKNRFGLGYQMGFNISARFKNLNGFASSSNPGAAIAGIDHTYDDGYNRVDTSGTNSSTTWFWGYENSSQLPGNGTVVMNSSSAIASSSSTERKDPQHGFELTYDRELGRLGKWKWGVETALGYTDVTISNNNPDDAQRISDAYTLGGAFPPAAPYHGTEAGPGFLIGTTPNRTVTTIVGGVKGNRQFDANIFGLRVGPYLELPLDDRWSLMFSGGFALLAVNSDFKFRETIVESPSQTRRGSGSHADFLPAAYISGNVLYAVRENVNLFAGAQFQTAATYSHKEGGKEVELDLGKSVFVNFGIAFSF
jgi:hypothetical protein